MADIFGKVLPTVKSLMDYRIFRQGVLSSNIANMDTPGYKAKDVNFEGVLEDVQQKAHIRIRATHPRHMQGGASEGLKYKVAEDPYSRIGNDSNTVDIDREMMKLTQNHLLYNASAQIVQQKLEEIKNTIRGIR
ncbi:MAG: flagellar basal body rod protein FlgB [Deltaproteobacteria bacterium]|nr:flagellar basal body rod protein FlgB [Deltaproteobacteria bacterium]